MSSDRDGDEATCKHCGKPIVQRVPSGVWLHIRRDAAGPLSKRICRQPVIYATPATDVLAKEADR